MTEEEWRTGRVAGVDSTAGLFLREVAHAKYGGTRDDSDREWRIIAVQVACLARLGTTLPDGVGEWVSQATSWLDREQRLKESDALYQSEWVYDAFREAYDAGNADGKQLLAAAQDIFHGGDYYACEELMLEEDCDHLTYNGSVYFAESKAHCDIIRDIFGNPFRLVAFDPAWCTEHTLGLALRMYDDREFAAMPILADALEEAGCENADILTHCREPGVHVRGCWVVDLVLGK